MKTALFVGRFQPLHRGHLYAMKHALKNYRLVILIGSTNKRDENNPFSFALRKRMIETALARYRNRIRITGVPDCRSDARWTKMVKKARFDVVISGSRWVKKCFEGFPLEKLKMIKRKEYNATHIRKLMKKGKKFSHLVPKEVAEIIMKGD